MTHGEFITSLTRSVRRDGAVAALAELRSTRPAIVDGAYHETIAVFFVWAVDRLMSAGLSDAAIIWHPLTDERTPLAWWDSATLATAAARNFFVSSDLASVGEPVPAEPRELIAA